MIQPMEHGVAFEGEDGDIIEDACWLRPADHCTHINLAELDEAVRGFNAAVAWGMQAICHLSLGDRCSHWKSPTEIESAWRSPHSSTCGTNPVAERRDELVGDGHTRRILRQSRRCSYPRSEPVTAGGNTTSWLRSDGGGSGGNNSVVSIN